MIGAVVISGVIYVLGSYALVIAFGAGHSSTLAADANPFHTAAKAFIPFGLPVHVRHPRPSDHVPWSRTSPS